MIQVLMVLQLLAEKKKYIYIYIYIERERERERERESCGWIMVVMQTHIQMKINTTETF